jgi:hypothetical protein
MKLGDTWIGWGLGDDNPKVADMKGFLRRKFPSYASVLNDSTVYDETMTQVVAEMQKRYGLPVTGVMNYATQVRCGYITPDPADKPTLLTVCGTGVPWWVGPDADLARAVESTYRWQPVGYGARPFPMWPSISEGRNELVRQINLFPGPIALAGYSQGAVVVGQVWKHDMLPSFGVLHHRLKDVQKAVTFGDPMREAGRAWSDGVSLARPESSGILDDRLEDTPDWWRSYAHANDLYTDCELDDEGDWKRMVCKIIMGHNIFTGDDGVIAQVAELLARPIVECIAIVKAIIDAGSFFGSGTRPHVTYNAQPAIDYLRGAA